MTAAELAALQLALIAVPKLIQYIDLASMANDLTDDQLATLKASEHQSVADFAAAVAAKKAA